jgi:hypothetical protein
VTTEASTKLRAELKEAIGPVTWGDLRKHLARDVIIIVAPETPILEAAVAIAENNQDQVTLWIKDGVLTKPNTHQLGHWEKNFDYPFLSVVVQPFILVQVLN